MKKVVVFTGAGVSEESGISTFRGNNGLWENYKIDEVATPQAWMKNPKLVLEFYDKRREQVMSAEPNDAHKAIADLQQFFDITIITQNVDDLHERAGSKNILHLHGEIMKSKSELDNEINPILYDVKDGRIKWGEKCPEGGQLRPHVVWFGETVPMMYEAEKIVEQAEIFIVVGTSLSVYPAAGLVYNVYRSERNYLIDPNNVSNPSNLLFTFVKEKAGKGMKMVSEILKNEYL